MKRCYSCKAEKKLSSFHKDSSRADGLSNKCKECRCKHKCVTDKKCLACGDLFPVDPMQSAQKYCGYACSTLHRRYGIDEYKYEDMLIDQDYSCAICRKEETGIDKRTGKVFSLSVDHCHKTGKIRGLLCTKCNTAIGLLNDDLQTITNALNYLKQ